MSFFNILSGYIRSKITLLILFVLQFAILFLVYSLYNLSFAPAVYAAILMCVAILLFGVWEFHSYIKEIHAWETIKRQASLHLERLPATNELKKRLCFEIIDLLDHRCLQFQVQAKRDETKMTQYYTIWSHQAKTPLAAMRLLLQEENLERRLLEQELFKTEQYVDMALQYQRLYAKTNDLVLRNYSLLGIVKQAIKRVSTLFIHKKIGIKIGQLDGMILTDEKWLIFVLEQILTNAVKYTPAGTVSVYSDGTTLFIQDTGIGISREDIPRIFDWGYTGYNGHSETRSTGIGLSLCKQALDLLGNSISMTSEVGIGTTVALDLSRKQFEIE